MSFFFFGTPCRLGYDIGGKPTRIIMKKDFVTMQYCNYYKISLL